VKNRVRGGRGTTSPTVEAGALDDFPVRPSSVSADPAVDPSLDARPTSDDGPATEQPER
jgi:choline/glycine/proline betaine transport protein